MQCCLTNELSNSTTYRDLTKLMRVLLRSGDETVDVKDVKVSRTLAIRLKGR